MTLSQRIAALTGPDRAVDAEVAVALGYRVVGVSVPLPRFTADPATAITASEPDWAIGFMWDHGKRTAHAAVGPNAHAGFALGKASVQHLKRETAIALALLSAAFMARGL